MRFQRKTTRLLVCDLDNTLYDWFGFFVPAFYEMIEKAADILHCDKNTLLDDVRAVHQEHGDTEHPFSLMDAAVVRSTLRGLDRHERFVRLDPAFHAFNSIRKSRLRLHEGVKETLETLRENNILLIAHTESKMYAAVDRLRRLHITGYFEKIYCRERPRSTHPKPEIGARWLDDFPMDKLVELSRHQAKPDESVLMEICAHEGVELADAAYVGDSVARDVLMAKRAGVYSIWAAYGAKHSPEEYDSLARVSHWTDEDVQREIRLRNEARTVEPDYICDNCFREVLSALRLPKRGAAEQCAM